MTDVAGADSSTRVSEPDSGASSISGLSIGYNGKEALTGLLPRGVLLPPDPPHG